jgi:segregation and condensation protein A
MMDFSTEKFQGPLALLLQMIEKEEMDITEIALASIADQYVAYVEQAKNIDLDEIADFLVVAARLLYIKSRALLPYLSSGENEAELDDLERQLRMYKEFVDASLQISTLINRERLMFTPVFNKNGRQQKKKEISFAPPIKLKVNDLKESWLLILARLKKREQKLPEERMEPKISIDERIGYIRGLLSEQLSLSFQNFLKTATSRVEVVINILAVLELAKQRELVFEQEELFSEIKVLKI